MLYLLDTDHMSLLERGGIEGNNLFLRLQQLTLDDYGVSIVSYAEQVRGWLAVLSNAATPAAEVHAFDLLQKNLRFYWKFAVWSYTEEAASIAAELKRQRVRIGTQDLRIAAITLANNGTLLTCNRRHFERVPDLRIKDWTL